MITIQLSLRRHRALDARYLRNGQEVTVACRSGNIWKLVIDDHQFAEGMRQTHDWIQCRDAQGTYVEMHIDDCWRVDRIAIFDRRHENAPPQLELFAS